jgi:hypothetical protein
MTFTKRQTNSLKAVDWPSEGSCPAIRVGHLGDAREAAHRVVARRDLRVAEVEEEEVLLPPCPLRLPIDTPQQVEVALGVEDDHRLAAADILTDEQFRQPGLAHPGGAQHQGVADPLAQVHPDIGFRRFDGVERGVAAGGSRVRRRSSENGSEPGERTGLQQRLPLGQMGLVQPLGVALVPAKAPAEEQPLP